jgi:AcrR family transcriptional regulator
VEARRRTKTAAIVTAAWELARKNGFGGVTLHAVARLVGMRQPSLYVYFDSKDALFDAMFADGNTALYERLESLTLPDNPTGALKMFMGAFVHFALEDAARYLLLFQRPIPSFEPSAESYATAERVLARTVEVVRAAGVEEDGDVDCFVAMIAGLLNAQMSNDPGGTRWVRHLDRMIDLHLNDAQTRAHTRAETRRAQ